MITITTPSLAVLAAVAVQAASASYAPLSASFVITVSSLNLTTAFNDSGIVFSSLNASDVISKAIAALPYPGGGTVLLRSGAYYLDAPISIERCSVTLRGESKGGDLYFNSDSRYHGYRNKSAVTLVATTSDAITIGLTTLVLGVTVEDLLITGVVDGDANLPRAMTTPGAGIRAERVDTFQLSTISVLRKEYGILLGPAPATFSYDIVQDVVSLENIYLAYNVWGLYAQQWVCNLRLVSLLALMCRYPVYSAYLCVFPCLLHTLVCPVCLAAESFRLPQPVLADIQGRGSWRVRLAS
jgi:hypothetical protein